MNISELPVRTQRIIKRADIPSKHRSRTLEDINTTEKVLEVLYTWAETVDNNSIVEAHGLDSSGLGLLLYGSPGSGKTTSACALLNTLAVELDYEQHQWMKQTRPLYFIRFPELLERRKRAFSGEDETTIALLDQIDCYNTSDRVSILVVDDLGKEYATMWTESNVDNLFRRRFDLGLPTIVTTNVNPNDWASLYGEASASFIYEAFIHVPIISPKGDRRRK